MRPTTLRTTALAAALALALTACGQKPGVHVDGSVALAEGAAPAAPGATQPLDAGTAPSTTTGTTGTTAGTTGTSSSAPSGGDSLAAGTSTQAGGTAGAQAPAGSNQAEPAPADQGASSADGQGASTNDGAQPAQRTPQGSDRTGVADDTLTLAIHAPVTGAAPLPTTSFEKSGDLYWKYLTQIKKQTVLGRHNVQVLFRDDKYSPDSARQVCRELSAKAFLVVGGGGTDQIQACGQLAQVAHFPYFSPGVTETGLAGNPWYFASSMTYKQQGRLLAQYVKNNPDGIDTLAGNPKVAAIVTNTSNFDDAVAGWEAGVKATGLNYDRTLRHPKGDTSWYASYAQQLKADGVQVVYINTSPVDYIRFAQVADEQFDYNPQYVGVGITMGLNAVLGAGCKDGDPHARVGDGIFFSPFFGLDEAHKRVPEFFQAGQQLGKPTDDIALALWGIAAQQDALFHRYQQTFGNDLTREDFRALVESTPSLKTPVFPLVGYSSQQHFGGQQVHVLRADCSATQYRTLRSFASSF